MKVSENLLLISLLTGTVYNFDNTVVRVLTIGLWAFLPLLGLLFVQGKFKSKYFNELGFSLILLFLLAICLVVNSETFQFNLSGPSVEMLTPFLFLFHGIALLLCLKVAERGVSSDFIFKFMLLLCCILLADVVVRFFQNPHCFLNYSCRYEAKTIGFFSTTNVVGQIVAFIIPISWHIKFKYKKILTFLLIVVLVTSMARAAILALLVVYVISYVFINRSKIKVLVFSILSISMLLLIVLDPFNLKADGSGQSKIDFFISVYNIVLDGSVSNMIFGYGASYSYIVDLLGVNGWSPHATVLKAVLYYGLTGLLFLTFLLVRMISIDHRMLLPILSFLVFGLAGAPIYWPTLSVGLILLLLSSSNNKSPVLLGHK